MPKITMSASVHSPFLSFYDALIAVCCTAYGDALLVRLPAILAILDDVALAVCNVYSKSVIHGKLSLEMVSVLVPLVLRAHCAIGNSLSFAFLLHFQDHPV